MGLINRISRVNPISRISCINLIRPVVLNVILRIILDVVLGVLAVFTGTSLSHFLLHHLALALPLIGRLSARFSALLLASLLSMAVGCTPARGAAVQMHNVSGLRHSLLVGFNDKRALVANLQITNRLLVNKDVPLPSIMCFSTLDEAKALLCVVALDSSEEAPMLAYT